MTASRASQGLSNRPGPAVSVVPPPTWSVTQMLVGCDRVGAGGRPDGVAPWAIRDPAGSSLGRYGTRRVQALGDTGPGGFKPWAIRDPAGSSLGRYGTRRVQALGDTGAGGPEPWALREPAGSSFGRYGIRRVQALGDTGAGGPEPWALREPAGSSFGRYGIRRVQALGDTGAGGPEPGATCVNSGVSRRGENTAGPQPRTPDGAPGRCGLERRLQPARGPQGRKRVGLFRTHGGPSRRRHPAGRREVR